MLVFHGYGSWDMVHELVLEGSFERWFSIGCLHFHMFLCWLSLRDDFILGIFLGLWMFMSLIFLWEAYIHDWSYGLGVFETSCWGFMEEIIVAQFTSRGVCRRTWYRLWLALFLLGLGYLLGCSVSLTLDLRLVMINNFSSCMSCERWHIYSFIFFLCWLWRTWESVGEFLWEFFL